jgi:hypothetical protein
MFPRSRKRLWKMVSAGLRFFTREKKIKIAMVYSNISLTLLFSSVYMVTSFQLRNTNIKSALTRQSSAKIPSSSRTSGHSHIQHRRNAQFFATIAQNSRSGLDDHIAIDLSYPGLRQVRNEFLFIFFSSCLWYGPYCRFTIHRTFTSSTTFSLSTSVKISCSQHWTREWGCLLVRISPFTLLYL